MPKTTRKEKDHFNKIKRFIQCISDNEFNCISHHLTNMLSKIDIDHRDIYGKTLLHYACQSKRKDIMQFLLKSGANPDIKDNKNRTPMHTLSIHTNTRKSKNTQSFHYHDLYTSKSGMDRFTFDDTFDILLRHSPSTLYIKDAYGKTPLDYCIKNGLNMTDNIRMNKIARKTIKYNNLSYKLGTYLTLRKGKKRVAKRYQKI
jgi:ankyrin repeat protein